MAPPHLREWVTGPRGDYLVVGGRADHVREETERLSASTIVFGSLGMLLLRRFSGVVDGGRVEVWWHDHGWVWRTADAATAVVAARAARDLLASGAWVPQEQPQPDLPQAARLRS